MTAPLPADAPERVGPYRITGILGRGGMGVVYRGRHEKLERPAALKRLRPELATTPDARARFLREARTAARLSHPSIVQIYDVLEDDHGDWIVMEAVAGDTLARRSLSRPLELDRAMDLGRQVAEGLGAAHRIGLIHRDLKSENVMVTDDGSAKILDFGLAKPLLDPQSAGLTMDGKVLGTCRSMSPEQAAGRRLDPRSDLFSFGTLLYETLTGESPFLADSAPATLHRVCTHAPAPVRQLNPDAPERLSDLVDRLLEKDPARRPSGADEVAEELAMLHGETRSGSVVLPAPRPDSSLYRATALAIPTVPNLPPSPTPAKSGPTRVGRRSLVAASALVLLLLLAVAAAWWLWPRPAPPAYVAVPEPEIHAETEAVDVDLLRAALRDGVLNGLYAVEGIRPVVPSRDVSRADSPTALAQALATREVLWTVAECDASRCDVRLERLRGEDGSLLWSDSVRTLVDRPDLTAEAVTGRLREAYADRTWKPASGAGTVPREAYAEYLRLTSELATAGGGETLDGLLEELASLRRAEPRFLVPYLLEAQWLRYRFYERREPADVERALELLASARRLAPDDPRPVEATAEVALTTGDLERAAEAVEELERRHPGSAEALTRRAELAERRGDGDTALGLLRDAARLHPSWRRLHRLARLEIRQGEPEAARRTLELCLSRVPEQPAALSSLAQLELLYGEPERAAELYGRLVETSDEITVRSNLGLALLLLERYEDAETHFRSAWERQSGNPQAALNLADALDYQGRETEADDLYRRVVELVDADPAGPAWALTVRAQALAHLGRRAEAAADVQEALRRAGDNPQTLFEAALTYSLVGDRASALVNALAALEAGVQPRWFRLPGFAPLQSEPEFRSALD